MVRGYKRVPEPPAKMIPFIAVSSSSGLMPRIRITLTGLEKTPFSYGEGDGIETAIKERPQRFSRFTKKKEDRTAIVYNVQSQRKRRF
jgi:hypothetical protein